MSYIPGTSPPSLQSIFEVIQGGAEVASSEVKSLIADNGAKIVDFTTRKVVSGNGMGAEVSEAVALGEGATTGTATGLAILGTEVSAGVAAIGIALGVVGGVALYNLAPEFFDSVAEELTEAGQTIGGKIVTFMDNTGKTSYTDTTINIVKNALLQEGIFDSTYDPTIDNNGITVSPKYISSFTVVDIAQTRTRMTSLASQALAGFLGTGYVFYDAQATQELNAKLSEALTSLFNQSVNLTDCVGAICSVVFYATRNSNPNLVYLDITYLKNTQQIRYKGGSFGVKVLELYSNCPQKKVTLQSYGSGRWYMYNYPYDNYNVASFPQEHPIKKNYDTTPVTNSLISADLGWVQSSNNFQPFYANYDLGLGEIIPSANTQQGATVPTSDPVGTTYPNWTPRPDPVPTTPDSVPVNRPVSIPIETGLQSDAQTGVNIGSQLDILTDIAYNIQPEPAPEPEPDPDPDPVPDPDPLPEVLPTPTPDPIDPNPDPPISGVTPTIPTISTTSANALFTVYNPTDSQLNSLGAFLWTNSIIETIKKIWENPIEGVIALHKIYVPPVTSGTGNIILGYVDSEVSSAIVSGQFVTVDCGTVTVPESKHNATDYSPFTQIQIYLPFIGIQELDTNEIMGGSVHVVYKVDVYTGTCLALIYVQRAEDMSNAQLLYTFSGNCSQKLPLTASDFGGAVSALLGIVGVGVASGGALGGAVAGGVAHSLTSDMVHIQHSGGLSANSGILAPRKPFIIISRQYGYDASGYNSIYGYPANKTVYLSNCSGFVRVKAIQYKGKGTATENKMIVDALKGGVII